jgi:hypothetical protein
MIKNYIFVFILLISFDLWGQEYIYQPYPDPGKGDIAGGFGLIWIDNQPYYSFRFNPDVSYGKFGAGLDLNLPFGADGKLRKEAFNETSDYLSIIRYVRYGNKKDPVFVKIGALDYYTLGHGSIMYMYNNSPSYDSRKIGLVADIDFDKYGFESIYSDLSQGGILGMRGYVRPLQFTDMADIPVIGKMEIGATFAGDFNNNAGIISAHKDSTNTLIITNKQNSVDIFGFDLGFPLISQDIFNLTYYIDYAKIINYGNGVSTGLIANLNGLGIIDISAKLERRWNGNQYLPTYFDPLYEIERFNIDPNTDTAITKLMKLKNTDSPNGFYSELTINILKLFQILGSYQRLDNDPHSGILHLGTDISPKDAPYVARAGYDKIYIKDGNDLFTLDDRSYLFIELGYKPYPFLLVSMIYNWTFTPERDKDNNVIGYTPQKRIEPRISFNYPIDVGD